MNELDKKMIIESLQEIINKLRDHDKMQTVSDLNVNGKRPITRETSNKIWEFLSVKNQQK